MRKVDSEIFMFGLELIVMWYQNICGGERIQQMPRSVHTSVHELRRNQVLSTHRGCCLLNTY